MASALAAIALTTGPTASAWAAEAYDRLVAAPAEGRWVQTTALGVARLVEAGLLDEAPRYDVAPSDRATACLVEDTHVRSECDATITLRDGVVTVTSASQGASFSAPVRTPGGG